MALKSHFFFQVPPIYELDTTDVSQWDNLVKNKAIQIIDSFINESPCEYQPLKSDVDEQKRNIDGNSYNYCDVCKRVFIGDNVYAIHLKSIRHMKVLKKKKRLENKCENEPTDKEP